MGSVDNVMCSGSTKSVICVESIFRSYFATFRIYTKGWTGKSIIIEQVIPYINGCTVDIDVMQIVGGGDN